MEKRIKERYSDAILKAAMHRYGIGDDQIRLLDGFESFIYEYQLGSQEYIYASLQAIQADQGEPELRS